MSIRPDNCYTLAELVVKYQTTKKVLLRQIADGKLPAIKVGRSWRVKPSALIQYEAAMAPKKPAEKKRVHSYQPSEMAIRALAV